VLIPNTHLETPAHEIVRLRHDQLNQEELAPPSYRMAETPPTEAYQPPSAQTETRPARPEAAVRGITPAQPAPVAEPKAAAAAPQPAAAEQGIISKIFGWFRGNRKTEPTTAEKSAAPARREREPSREGRGERGRGRGERARQEPRERQEQRQRGQQRPEQEARGERRPRPERSERPQQQEQRPPKQPRPQQEQRPAPAPAPAPDTQAAPHSALETPPPGSGEGQEEQRRGRRGRRGRGRDRGERRGEAQTGGTEAEQAMPAAHQALADEQKQPAIEEAISVSTPVVEIAPAPVPLPAEPMASSAEPVLASEPAPAPVPLSRAEFPAEQEAIAMPSPAAAETAPEAPAPVIAAPPKVDIQVALEASGLILVETSRDKAATLPAAPESEIRLGRKPRPASVIPQEPMVQVETRK